MKPGTGSQTDSQGKNKHRTQINTLGNEGREVTTNITEVQKILREYYEKFYGNKLDNPEEMDELLETCNLPKLNQEKQKI